jgi:hypothetical protein
VAKIEFKIAKLNNTAIQKAKEDLVKPALQE